MANDNGPKIVTALWAMSGISFLFMCLRFFCKGVHNRQLMMDDAVLLLSWCLAMIYSALINTSVHYGMGKKHDDLPDTTVLMYKYLFLGEFFTLIAIPVSKTSFSITLLRIAARPRQKCFIWFVIITVNIIYWLCGIFLLVQCQPIEKNWNKKMAGKCWNSSVQDNYSIFAGAYSALLDFVLATFPTVIIYKLQMSNKEKAGVIIAMSLGVLAGITAAVKTSFLPGIGKFSDPTYQLADLLIWSNAEVSVTIIAASIPFFRVLLRAITSSYLHSKPPYRQSYQLESYSKGHDVGTGRRHPQVMEIVESPRSDDWSDRSILGDGIIIAGGGAGVGGLEDGKIVKSSEVTIEYSEEKKVEGPLYKV